MTYRLIYTNSYIKRASKFVKKHPELISQYGKTLKLLEIDPNHKEINEYLGELYVVTNRINLAKERLNVLANCNCEEYGELKEIIDGTKQSKY